METLIADAAPSKPKPYKTLPGISAPRAGKIAGVRGRVIIRWCKRFGLPHSRSPAGKVRIDKAELITWLATSRPKPKEPRPLYKRNPGGDVRGGVIYALTDPRPEKLGRVRYVGKTEDLKKRRREYRREFIKGGHNPALEKWFKKLRAAGLKPGLKILEECLFGLNALEQAWIAKGRAKGWELLNCTGGGEGGEWNEEARKRQSERTKALYRDPQYVANYQASILRRFGSAEDRNTKMDTDRAARRGVSVDQYREWRTAFIEDNQRRAAANKARRELRTLRAVPLTWRGAAFVPLNHSKWAMVDAEDWERVNARIWSAQSKGRYWRAKTNGPNDSLILLNRFVMGAGSGDMVPHRNGNQLDCRRSNLSFIRPVHGRPPR